MLVGHIKAVQEGNMIVTSVTIRPYNGGFLLDKKHEYEEMKCVKCGNKTVAKKNLVRHKKYEHDGIKYRPGKFVCNQCSTLITSSWGLRLHKRSEHEGVTYDCDQCDYKEPQQIHLVQHKQ